MHRGQVHNPQYHLNSVNQNHHFINLQHTKSPEDYLPNQPLTGTRLAYRPAEGAAVSWIA